MKRISRNLLILNMTVSISIEKELKGVGSFETSYL